MDFTDYTIRELQTGLVSKKFSSKELADFYLERLKKYDGEIHAYLTVTEEEAKEMAKTVDSRPPQPRLAKGGVQGIPAGIKDLIVTKGIRSTGGSKILENYIPPFDATIIKKLKQAGYVLLGKENCDEFAKGSSTENSAYGVSYNPWDKTRVPGGTSGGSAAAVAAGLSHYSIGTDTGGSVRQPASFCGVVGLKPTYGRVSRYGIMAMTSSFELPGVLARRVSDVADVLQVIEGEDPLDATSASPPPNPLLGKEGELKGIKVGVPKEYWGEGLDGQVKDLVKKSIDQLAELGAEVKEVSLPNFEYALATYYIIMFAEASSNMARYDSIRYGQSIVKGQGSNVKDLIDLYRRNRAEFLGDEVKRRIMLGTYVLSAGYYEAYYARAQKVRQLIIDDFKKVFNDIDVLAGPVAPTPAFKIGQHLDDPLAMYLEDIYTVPVNLAGLPAVSVPVGFAPVGVSRDRPLPVGLHLIGKWWEDYELLSVADVFEKVNEYYKERPGL